MQESSTTSGKEAESIPTWSKIALGFFLPLALLALAMFAWMAFFPDLGTQTHDIELDLHNHDGASQSFVLVLSRDGLVVASKEYEVLPGTSIDGRFEDLADGRYTLNITVGASSIDHVFRVPVPRSSDKIYVDYGPSGELSASRPTP